MRPRQTGHPPLAAGISYGVTKGFFNEGSWNFANVAADAFGNALGNSVVRAQVESSNRNQYLAEQSALLGDRASNYVNANLNANLENSTAKAMAQAQQQGAANLNRVVSQQRAQSDADFEAAIVANQNAGAQRASNFVAQSDAYFRQGNVMASRHLQQMQGIQETISNSFANGQARGEASYLNGMNNRTFTGLDVRSDALAQAAYENSIWSQGRQNAQDFSDGIDSAGRVIGKSFDYLANFDEPFGKIFDKTLDVLSLESLKNQPITSNTLSLSGKGALRNMLEGSINANLGVQSDGTVAYSLSYDGSGGLSEKHFRPGHAWGASFDTALLNWEPAKSEARLENILKGYSSQTDYDFTGFKLTEIGYQQSTAWEGVPYSSNEAATGSGFRVELNGLFSKSPRASQLIPLEISTGVGKQFDGYYGESDWGAAGRWLYQYTRY